MKNRSEQSVQLEQQFTEIMGMLDALEHRLNEKVNEKANELYMAQQEKVKEVQSRVQQVNEQGLEVQVHKQQKLGFAL